MRAGDTLYSIAWESGRDYRDLAAWNDLPVPYVIKPGQRLRLYPPRRGHPTHETASVSSHVVRSGETVHGIARSRGVRPKDLIAWNGLKPPYLLTPGQRLRLTSSETKTALAKPREAVTKTTTTAAAPHEPDERGAIAWVWPTEGAVAVHFAPNSGEKGIDIAGTAGQAIRAAAGGKVVYQGSGLRGYGQLIIIKHNADFLSAYAHCAAINVQEGSVIKAGQKIAAMGSSGTDRVKLHFEIRRRGTPVDPLGFLPRK